MHIHVIKPLLFCDLLHLGLKGPHGVCFSFLAKQIGWVQVIGFGVLHFGFVSSNKETLLRLLRSGCSSKSYM